MSRTLDVARAAAGLNVLFLLALGSVWLRNYRAVRSKQGLGMVVFCALLLGENALALFYYLTSVSLPAAAVESMMWLQLLETAALAFLTWVTWD